MNIAIIVILASLSQVADAPKLDEKQLVQLLEPHFQTQAAKYEFFLDEARQQKLELVEKPVMRWTAEGNLGAVWVWTRLGRAEAVGCLGAYVRGYPRRMNLFMPRVLWGLCSRRVCS